MAAYRRHVELHAAIAALSLTAILGKLIQMGVGPHHLGQADFTMSVKKRVHHGPKQIVEKLQEADRLLNARQSLGQVMQA
jgi:hypothetical protein